MPRYTTAIFFFFIEHLSLVPFRIKLGMKLHRTYEFIDSISFLVPDKEIENVKVSSISHYSKTYANSYS